MGTRSPTAHSTTMYKAACFIMHVCGAYAAPAFPANASTLHLDTVGDLAMDASRRLDVGGVQRVSLWGTIETCWGCGYREVSGTPGGNGGGGEFDPFNTQLKRNIKQVQVFNGNHHWIDKITVTFQDGTEYSAGGGWETWAQDPFIVDGDPITNVKQWFSYSKDRCGGIGTGCLTGLMLTTRSGRSVFWGGSDGNYQIFQAVIPTGDEVVSFYGRAGWLIDSLGWYITSSCNSIAGVSGRWVPVGSAFGPSTTKQTYQFDVGTTRSRSITSSTKFEENAQLSISAGFSFGVAGFGANVDVEASSSITNTVEDSVSGLLKETTTKSETFEFGPGQVWQWVVDFDAGEGCGSSSSTQSRNFQLTQGANYPPCCPYGGFKDAHDPRGDCIDNTSICA